MKRIFVAVTLLAMVMALNTPVFAHGGGHRTQKSTTSHAWCEVEGCELSGTHQHDGSQYCGRAGEQGSYTACTVNGCTTVGIHEHDGANYTCANHAGGTGCGGGRSR